jgi:hypothetical protein
MYAGRQVYTILGLRSVYVLLYLCLTGFTQSRLPEAVYAIAIHRARSLTALGAAQISERVRCL